MAQTVDLMERESVPEAQGFATGLMVMVLVAIPLLAICVVWLLSLHQIVGLALIAATAVALRHVAVVRNRGSISKAWSAAQNLDQTPDVSKLPAMYQTYVLGSGGHTGELCEMIRQSFRPGSNQHRRYIITTGDTHSHHACQKLEDQIRSSFSEANAGTSDVLYVERARRVHQPLWSSGYTSLLSAQSIVSAILRTPKVRVARGEQDTFRVPHVIVTNGPGTGFIVCLVVHLLKMMFVIPQERTRVIYIETWAHLTTLSLTGKLFHYTGIADLFMVQHEKLAQRTGAKFVGAVTRNGNLVGIKGLGGTSSL